MSQEELAQRSFRSENAIALSIVALIVITLTLYANLIFFIDFFQCSFEWIQYVYPFEKQSFNNNLDLGAEYYSLAENLYRRGFFGNPFDVETGPSAWMPPLYSFIMYLALYVSGGSKFAVMIFVVVLKIISISFSGWLLLYFRWAYQLRVSKTLVVSLFTLWLYQYFVWLFMNTHDNWLVALLCDCQLLLFHFLLQSSRRKGYLAWGVIGSLSGITSPALVFTYGLLTLILLLKSARRQQLFLSLALASLLPGCWTIRNYLVFQRFIPLKSNIFFELAFSTIYSQNGVYTFRDFGKHPYHLYSVSKQPLPKDTDEFVINQKLKAEFLEQMKNAPELYWHKVTNRLSAATLIYPVFHPRLEWKTLTIKKILYPLTFLALLFMLLYWRRLSVFEQALIGVWCAVIIPYIFIAFYVRYYLYLSTVHLLLQIFALSWLLRGRNGASRGLDT